VHVHVHVHVHGAWTKRPQPSTLCGTMTPLLLLLLL
jgi:hypothetical protein